MVRKDAVRLALGLIACVLPGVALADKADAILVQAKADCASLDNGTFTTTAETLIRQDLTGDGTPDTIVDSRGFVCSTSASFWSGTGGYEYWVVVADRVWDLQAQDWRIIDWNGTPVLLEWLNGGACGGNGAQNCVGALVWDAYGEDFMTVAKGGP